MLLCLLVPYASSFVGQDCISRALPGSLTYSSICKHRRSSSGSRLSSPPTCHPTHPTMTAPPVGPNTGIVTPASGLSGVKNVIAVASCKGGVGKSTTCVNLAFTLANEGFRVGIVDVDIHGSSLPVMVAPDDPHLRLEGNQLIPLQSQQVKLMSMGYINRDPMILRGAKITPIVTQLVTQTDWGKLDYLLIDMPPGTGDVHLTLTQNIQITAAVIVTTPQRLSFADVVKGIEMFDKVGVPCVAVVENMAALVDTEMAQRVRSICERQELTAAVTQEIFNEVSEPRLLFGPGHKARLVEMWGIKQSFQLPLDPSLSAQGDIGTPFVLAHPSSKATSIFRELGQAVVQEVTKLRDNSKPRPDVQYNPDTGKIVVNLFQQVSPVELRKACKSPANVPALVRDDVHPLEIVAMGNYAVTISWSDGHQSLFPYAAFVEGYES